MKFILVPFLLAIRVPDDDTWNYDPLHYGPEYTYSAFVRTSIYNETLQMSWLYSSFSCYLICRPVKRDRLMCYIRGPAMKTAVPREDYLMHPPVGELRRDIPFDYVSSIPFEIIFNSYGIKKYNIIDGIYPSTYFVNLSRAIIDQLNVGANIMRTENTFRAKEQSNLGKCPTNYVLDESWFPHHLKADKYNHTLVPIPGFKLYTDKLKFISKIRTVDKCSSRNDYMFTANHMPTFIEGQTIKHSLSKMVISKHIFASETMTTYVLRGKMGVEIGVMEHIQLSFDSAKPAKSRDFYNLLT